MSVNIYHTFYDNLLLFKLLNQSSVENESNPSVNLSESLILIFLPETNCCIRFVIYSKSVFEKKKHTLLVKWLIRCKENGRQVVNMVRVCPHPLTWTATSKMLSTHYVGPITKSNGPDSMDLFFGENYQRRHAHEQTWDLISPATSTRNTRSLFDSVNLNYDTCQHLSLWYVSYDYCFKKMKINKVYQRDL